MKISAAQLAQLLSGTLEGDPNATAFQPARIESAQTGDFAFLDNPKYEPFAYTTEASILLVNTDFRPEKPVKPALIRVDNVRDALAKLLAFIEAEQNKNKTQSGEAAVHPTAQIGEGSVLGLYTVVEEGAVIGANCTIYPQVFIGRNARIGDGCTLYPGARVHRDCVIGNHCILHANAVIGADGFGYAPQEDKSWKKVPQVGNVVLEDEVEIGACTCIDRAVMGSTLIRKGAKLDNLVHVAHNVEIGRNSIFAAQAGIAGSAKIGEAVQVGGQAGFAGHLTIADGVKIQAQSGIASSIDTPNTAVFGSPAIGYKDFIRSHAVFKQLPELYKRLQELERKLEIGK